MEVEAGWEDEACLKEFFEAVKQGDLEQVRNTCRCTLNPESSNSGEEEHRIVGNVTLNPES